MDRTYDDSYFEAGGAGYSGYLRDAEIMIDRGRWYGELLRRYMEPGTVLDVGAAAGFVLKGLVDSGWDGHGVEPNATMAEHARTLGLRVETGTMDELAFDGNFDLVSLIQVVAHFTDVRHELRLAVDRIAPGGHLLVETWNRDSLTARCLGKHWHEYSPPSVLNWFSPDGLRTLGGQLGLEEIACGRPRKRISGGHAKSLLRFRLEGSAVGRLLVGALSVVPDGLTLPYPAEDLFWMLLRK